MKRAIAAECSHLLLAGMVLTLTACGDTRLGPAPASLEPTPFRISEAQQVRTGAASQGTVIGPGSASVAWISLPPDSIPGGVIATLQNARTGYVTSTAVVGGGFDPVAVSAEPGDTIRIAVTLRDGALPEEFEIKVPPAAPPVIVRTDPPPHKPDVPLNAALRIVFSEPIGVGSLNAASVHLRAGSTMIAGALAFENVDETIVTFTPLAALVPGTSYTLEITAAVRDRAGDALQRAVTVPFTTAPSQEPAPLQLVTSVPAAGAADVSILQPVIRLWFSERVEFAAEGALTLLREGVPVPTQRGCWGPRPSTCASLGLIPRQLLEPNTVYQVSITAARGESGAELAAPIVFSFRTEVIPPGPTAALLTLTSFTMNEFEYAGSWYYAPMIRLTETGGTSSARVVKMVFHIPGLEEPIPALCTAGVNIPAGGSTDMFREVYGDWEVYFSNRDGARGTGGDATATVYFRDAFQRLDSLDIRGPIVPAPPLTTYTGGPSHGYDGGCM